jgi:hypothetical protein
MFTPTRDQSRDFLFEAWRKYKVQEPLSDLEGIAIEHILAHPEYQPVLDAPEKYRERTYSPESGEPNPFLHLMFHVALSEQLSIDQPAGVRARYERVRKSWGDAHDAQHAVLECLAEMIWQAQRQRQPFDGEAYLECMERKR